MPVRKFRSVEAMNCDLWLPPGDPRLWRAIVGVWELAARMAPTRLPPGVYKHRTIEEANRQRDEFDAMAVQQARERRR